MASNNGGPWGGGGRSGGSDGSDNSNSGDNNGVGGGQRPPRRPNDPQQMPELDEIVRKGQEQLRLLMGGRNGGNGGRPGAGGPGGSGNPLVTKRGAALAAVVALGIWGVSSFYTVKPEEQSVELFLGKFSSIGQPGLNFAPWPFVTAEVVQVTGERNENIGVSTSSSVDTGLMLTTDENIVDIDFQVVWNINDPAKFLFNLRDAPQTIRAVSESAMREIIASSELAPILNRDRGAIADAAHALIQSTLDSYDSGMNVVRVNLDKADPPREVIDAFREVQAAEQARDRLEREADAYANTILAGARGGSAQILEEAEAYRAQVVNEAEGEASRFKAVLGEYKLAPEVTRKRLYLETMESVFADIDKVIMDENAAQGVVPYLPLPEVRGTTKGQAGGNN